MDVSLPFVIQQRKRKEREPVKRKLIKIRSDYTPMEIQNMDMPQLEYVYEHGSPTEREMADHIIQARKKWALVELAAPMNNELASGSPFAGGIR